MMILLCALLPVILGCLSSTALFREQKSRAGWALISVTLTSLLLAGIMIWGKDREPAELFRLSDQFRFVLHLDGKGKVFLGIAALLWPPAMLYAGEYMKHEKRKGNFFLWYTVAYGPAVLLGTAGNLFTLYMAYELLTLCTVPLVWHGRDRVSERAAVLYLLFLVGGASLGFIAMSGLGTLGTGSFSSNAGVTESIRQSEWFRTLCLVGFLGFGVKAAVLPLSRWLPTASVAPTPVTALLHAVAVVNAGVFAVMRLLYDAVPCEALRGTWVQTAMLLLSALTIVYGAMMAVREKHIKRRLAWSTVSNHRKQPELYAVRAEPADRTRAGRRAGAHDFPQPDEDRSLPVRRRHHDLLRQKHDRTDARPGKENAFPVRLLHPVRRIAARRSSAARLCQQV